MHCSHPARDAQSGQEGAVLCGECGRGSARSALDCPYFWRDVTRNPRALDCAIVQLELLPNIRVDEVPVLGIDAVTDRGDAPSGLPLQYSAQQADPGEGR
jgi:hypothetical protein